MKLCSKTPVVLAGSVTKELRESLEKAISKAVSKELVGLEAERAQELIRSAKRVLKNITVLQERVAAGDTNFTVIEDDVV